MLVWIWALASIGVGIVCLGLVGLFYLAKREEKRILAAIERVAKTPSPF